MSTFVWPSEDGWPYPDTAREWADPETAGDDDDLLSVRVDARLLDGLDPLERRVLAARFGLEGRATQSVDELHDDLGLPTADVETLLASGLTKLRARLT